MAGFKRQSVLIIEIEGDERYKRFSATERLNGYDILLARTLDSACYLSRTFRPQRIIVPESFAAHSVGGLCRALREGNPDVSVLVTAAGPEKN